MIELREVLKKDELDIPEISMKSIRIFTNVYIYQTMIRQADGKEITVKRQDITKDGWKVLDCQLGYFM